MFASIWGPPLQTPAPPALCRQRDRGTRVGTVWRRASQGSWREASEASWSGFGVSGGAGWSRGSEKGKGVDRTEGRGKESQEFSGGNRGDRKTPGSVKEAQRWESSVKKSLHCNIETGVKVARNSPIKSMVASCLRKLKFNFFVSFFKKKLAS